MSWTEGRKCHELKGLSNGIDGRKCHILQKESDTRANGKNKNCQVVFFSGLKVKVSWTEIIYLKWVEERGCYELKEKSVSNQLKEAYIRNNLKEDSLWKKHFLGGKMKDDDVAS